MSVPRGLADKKEYEAFYRRWYDAVLEEAKRWCREEDLQKLLAEAVMTEFRGQYADRTPPNNPEFSLRAQVCLVYSLTGENREKLEGYLAAHRFPEKSESPSSAPEEDRKNKDDDHSQRSDPEQSVTQAEEKPAERTPEEAKQREKASSSDSEGAENIIREEKQVKDLAPPEARPMETNGAPSTQIPESTDLQPSHLEATGQNTEATVDTIIDPVRTTLWTTNSDIVYHKVQEVEIPDTEEEDRSVGLSFLNTILFLLVLASFAFFVYETGVIQYLIATVR